MKNETSPDKLWLQKEVIEYLRCAPSSFHSCERYDWLKERAIKDGRRRKYKNSDVLAFVERLKTPA